MPAVLHCGKLLPSCACMHLRTYYALHTLQNLWKQQMTRGLQWLTVCRHAGDYNEPDDLPSEVWRDLGVDRRETGHSAIDHGNVTPLLPHALNVDHRGQYAEDLLDLCEGAYDHEWCAWTARAKPVIST
jgi:hypothetical protein